jgi:hypothetical protein
VNSCPYTLWKSDKNFLFLNMKYKGENGSVHCLYIAIPAQKEHNFYRTLITQRNYSHCIVEIMKIIKISKLSKILSKGLQTTHGCLCLWIVHSWLPL